MNIFINMKYRKMDKTIIKYLIVQILIGNGIQGVLWFQFNLIMITLLNNSIHNHQNFSYRFLNNEIFFKLSNNINLT